MQPDPKRHLWLFGLAIPVMANTALFGFARAPQPLRTLCASAGLITLHGVIPFFDQYFAQDQTEVDLEHLEDDPYYIAVVAAYLPLQYSANLYAAALHQKKHSSLLETALLGSLLGLVNVVGINIAHELGHKKSKYQQRLAHIALLPSAYQHFRIEHNYGHHRFVATPQDPASAYYGESFWDFLPRTVIGGFKSAIQIEKRRLARKKLSFWHPENELLKAWAVGAAYHISMCKIFGKKWLFLQAIQISYSIILLEAVNYMEHYGLKRQRLANGTYAPVTPQHSWNHNSLCSNLLFYQLQRHSDHHAHPTRPFQLLKNYANVPTLPKGYGALFSDVFMPKRWFKLIDPHLLAYYQGDLDQVHQRSDHPKHA